MLKNKHKKIIDKKLKEKYKIIDIELVYGLPKPIKFHIHISDGFSNRKYYFKIIVVDDEKKVLVLYCQLSTMFLDMYYDVTFWTKGSKWMKRFRLI